MSTFKLYLAEQDIRRISFPTPTPTWDDFVQQLEKIYPQTTPFSVANLKLQYVDDEGDKCTVSSQPEWTTMFELASSDNNLSKLHKIWITPQQSPPQQQRGCEFRRERRCHNWAANRGDQTSSPQPRNCEQFKYRRLRCLHRRAYNNIGPSKTKEQLELAKTLLKEIISLAPADPTALYNLACVDSLMGNLSESIEWLEKAVQNGYRDVEHIRTDADLDNVRELSRFILLVQQLSPGLPVETKEEEVVVEEKNIEPPVVTEPEEVKEQQQPEEEKQVIEEPAEAEVVICDDDEAFSESFENPTPELVKLVIKEEPDFIFAAELAQLCGMGFDDGVCRYFLDEYKGDLDAVLNRLL